MWHSMRGAVDAHKAVLLQARQQAVMQPLHMGVGIGALYKRRGLVIEPQISGGASTTIYRSGTPTLGLAVSLDAALTKALAGQDADVLGEGGTPLFAALLTAADKLGMQYVATAHRARVETGADGVHTVCPPAGTGSAFETYG